MKNFILTITFLFIPFCLSAQTDNSELILGQWKLEKLYENGVEQQLSYCDQNRILIFQNEIMQDFIKFFILNQPNDCGKELLCYAVRENSRLVFYRAGRDGFEPVNTLSIDNIKKYSMILKQGNKTLHYTKIREL